MSHADEVGVVPPRPASSAWLRRAVWARWILLACYVAFTLAWYFVALTPQDPLGLSVQGTGWVLVNFLIATLALFGLQLLLLLGAPHLHWPRPRRGRSIFVSLAAGSAIATMLSLGIVCALASLHKLIDAPDSFRDGLIITSISPGPATAPSPPTAPVPAPFDWRTDIPWAILGVVLAAWTFWFLVFALIGRGEWTRRFSRMYRMLIAGTILELLITIPIDVQVRRRTNCYCGEGTFFSLAIGLTAILWVFGPGVAILFFIRRRQRLGQTGCCLQCGYNLRGLTSDRCPECGMMFRQGLSHAPA